MDEFEFIDKYLSPLAGPAGLNLKDDVAVLAGSSTHDFILSVDSYVEGVHFPQDWPLNKIAPRILPAALSDLVAKGARPRSYMMSLMLPDTLTSHQLSDLCYGFKTAQQTYKVWLIGGDTVRTSGPLIISLSVFGAYLPDSPSPILQRNQAKVGDDIWVTGTIGDAYLGLQHHNAPSNPIWERAYDMPELRAGFSIHLPGLAHASADISDGLIADLSHIATASEIDMTIQLNDIPVSRPTQSWLDNHTHRQDGYIDLITAGDDYEIIFTAPPNVRAELDKIATRTHTSITRIGTCTQGSGVTCLDGEGRALSFTHKGYTHF